LSSFAKASGDPYLLSPSKSIIIYFVEFAEEERMRENYARIVQFYELRNVKNWSRFVDDLLAVACREPRLFTGIPEVFELEQSILRTNPVVLAAIKEILALRKRFSIVLHNSQNGGAKSDELVMNINVLLATIVSHFLERANVESES